MKKKFAFLLTAALTAATAFTVMAAEEVTGEWYANFYGIPATLTLDESGEYTMAMELEGEDADTGSWELDGESLIMDKGEEKELTLTYDGETLYAEMDGMEMIFSRDPEAAAGFVPAEIRTDAAIEDFAGKWTGTQVSALGMTAPLEMIEMEKAEVEIKENLITFTMAGGFLFGEWEISDIEAELKDGTLSFVVPAQDEYSEDSEWSIRLHEDGMLSLSTTAMDEEIVIYMEAISEEGEEAAE